MAAAIARLYAEMDLRNGKFLKGAREVEHESGRMRKALGSVAATAAGFLAANVIQKGLSTVKNEIGNVIGAASDMGETLSKANAVFDGNASGVIKWAQDAEQNLGMADQAALESASTFGNLFKGIGIGGGETVSMSENIIQASADLASFNNVAGGSTQVAEDLRSALLGEAEPVRKYGILINEAAVKAKGLALGLTDANGEMSEGAKVQARYALIMEQLGDANGDFAKTSGGAANGARILRANFQGFQVWLGSKLLPTYTKIIAGTNRWFKTFADFRSKGFSPFMAGINALQKGLTNVFGAQTATMITAFLLDVGDRIKAVVGFIQTVLKVFRLFHSQGVGFFDALAEGVAHALAAAFGPDAAETFATFYRRLKTMLATARTIVTKVFGVVLGIVKLVLRNFDRFGPIILGVVVAFKAYQLVMRTVAIVQGVVSAATAILTAVMGTQAVVAEGAAVATRAAWLSMLGPIAIVVAAVALFALAYHKNWLGIRDITNRVVGWVVKQFQRLMAVLRGGKGLGKALDGLPRPLQKVAILARRIVVLLDDIIHGRWDQVRGDIDKIGKTLGNLLKSLGLKNFGQEFKRAFDLVVTIFSDVITLIGDLIHGRWGKLWDDFLAILKDVVNLGIEYFRLSLSLWRDIFAGLVALFNAIPWSDIGSILWTGIKLAFKYSFWLIPGLILKVLGTVDWGKIADRGRDVISYLWTGISSLIGWLINQVYAIPNGIIQVFGNFASWFYDIGRNIVSGIWTGIASLGGWLWSQITAFVQNNITNPVKAILGIDSPSKVMAEMGRYTVAGFALGIDKTAGMAARASAQMAQGAANAANGTRMTPGMGTPRLASMPALAGANGAGGGGGNMRSLTIAAGAIVVNGAGDPEKVAAVIMKRIRYMEAGAA